MNPYMVFEPESPVGLISPNPKPETRTLNPKPETQTGTAGGPRRGVAPGYVGRRGSIGWWSSATGSQKTFWGLGCRFPLEGSIRVLSGIYGV